MKINWKEVFKFMSGAFFVSTGVNWYMYFNRISPPFFGWKIPYRFLGIRGIIHFLLFSATLFFGFIKKDK